MTIKTKILKALEGLPADASYEDAIERLVFLAKIERGLEQADAGRSISHTKVKLSLAKLLKRITKDNRPGELDWGPPVGREVW